MEWAANRCAIHACFSNASGHVGPTYVVGFCRRFRGFQIHQKWCLQFAPLQRHLSIVAGIALGICIGRQPRYSMAMNALEPYPFKGFAPAEGTIVTDGRCPEPTKERLIVRDADIPALGLDGIGRREREYALTRPKRREADAEDSEERCPWSLSSRLELHEMVLAGPCYLTLLEVSSH